MHTIKVTVTKEVSANLSPEYVQKFDLYLISKQNLSYLISSSSDKNSITQSNAVVLCFDDEDSSSWGSRKYEACFIENGAWVLNRLAKILRVPMRNQGLRNAKIGKLQKTPEHVGVIRSVLILKNRYFGIIEDQKQYQEALTITAFDDHVDNPASLLEAAPQGCTLKVEIQYWEKMIEQYKKECLNEKTFYKELLTVYQREVLALKNLNLQLLSIKEEIITFNNDAKKITGVIDYNNNLIANLVPVVNQETISQSHLYSALANTVASGVLSGALVVTRATAAVLSITDKLHAAVTEGVVMETVLEDTASSISRERVLDEDTIASFKKAITQSQNSAETKEAEECHSVQTAEQFEHVTTFFKKLIRELQDRFVFMQETLLNVSKNLQMCKGSIEELTLQQTEAQSCSAADKSSSFTRVDGLKSEGYKLKQTSKQYKQATVTLRIAIDKIKIKISQLLEQVHMISEKQSKLRDLHTEMSQAYQTCVESYGQLYATQDSSLQTFYSSTKNGSQELIELLLEFDESLRKINPFIQRDFDSDEKHTGSIVGLIQWLAPECRRCINDIKRMIPNIVNTKAQKIVTDALNDFEDKMSAMLELYINSFRELISNMQGDDMGETVGLGGKIVQHVFSDENHLSTLESVLSLSTSSFAILRSSRDDLIASMLTLLDKDLGSEVRCSMLTQYAGVSTSRVGNVVAVMKAEEKPVVLHSTSETLMLRELYELYKQDKSNVENTYKVAESLHRLGQIEKCLFYLNICTHSNETSDYVIAAYKLKIDILNQKGEHNAVQSEIKKLLPLLKPGTKEYESFNRLAEKINDPKTQVGKGMQGSK